MEFNFSENVNIEHIMPASGKNISIIRQDAGIADKEEFLAIVHALEWMKESKISLRIYSDSGTALAWVKKKKINFMKITTRVLLWLKK